MKPDDFLKDHRFFKRPCVEMMSEGERGRVDARGGGAEKKKDKRAEQS